MTNITAALWARSFRVEVNFNYPRNKRRNCFTFSAFDHLLWPCLPHDDSWRDLGPLDRKKGWNGIVGGSADCGDDGLEAPFSTTTDANIVAFIVLVFVLCPGNFHFSTVKLLLRSSSAHPLPKLVEKVCLLSCLVSTFLHNSHIYPFYRSSCTISFEKKSVFGIKMKIFTMSATGINIETRYREGTKTNENI